MLTLAPPARHLETTDLGWATDLLSAALAAHPTLSYLCPGPEAGARSAWLLRSLLRFSLHYGSVYTNPENTALAIWLSPGRVAVTPARLLRAGVLPAAPWHLGYAGFRRLRRLLAATSWLRRQSLSMPHHHLLALAVHPQAQGQGIGRRLLLATLAIRQTTQAPCYLDTQVPAHLAFYQRLGFRLLGQCTVGEEPYAFTSWGMSRPPRH